MLFDKGTPLPHMTLLACKIPSASTHLLGCITQTGKDRLIFWPPLPKDTQLLSADGRQGVTDHVTLELFNRKSHVTSFNAAGQRNHHRNEWILDVHEECSLSLWFSLVVPFSVLREQDHAMNVGVPMPRTDARRRVEEFKRCTATCRVETLSPVPHEFVGDYLFCLLYVQTGTELTDRGLHLNLCQQDLDKFVTGFRDDVPVAFSPTPLLVGDSRVIVYSAAPPGTATNDVMCGFPTRRKPPR
jgi:hypothetical protein